MIKINTHKSILVIEDDHDIRVCYREALDSQRFTVHSATSGSDGLFLLQKLKTMPDLIILDLGMPLMGGEEFLRHKEKNEMIKNIPVLVISNNAGNLSSYWKVPALKKPIDLDEFISKVEDCLSKV